jgi:hypothetical protein
MEPFQNPPFAQALYIQSLVLRYWEQPFQNWDRHMKVSEMIVFVLNKKIGAGQLQMDEVLQKNRNELEPALHFCF